MGRTPKLIFQVNDTFTWLREPLLGRLPDGSLCCVFFTGGSHDGDLRNVVAAIRSDDDGESWSQPEILKRLPDQSAWAPSMIVHGSKAHIFWFSSRDGHRYRKINHLLSTDADGRTFTEDREILAGWNGERGIDVRHGTVLHDGRVLLPIAWMEPQGDFDPDTWVPDGTNKRYGNFGWGGHRSEQPLLCRRHGDERCFHRVCPVWSGIQAHAELGGPGCAVL